jgi:hypothetical protein
MAALRNLIIVRRAEIIGCGTQCLLVLTMIGLCFSDLCAQYPDVEPVPERFAAGFSSISSDDSRELLKVIAGPEFSGRGTGQEGYQKAAVWFADQLAQLGFEPAGTDGSWFQNLPFIRLAVDPKRSGVKLGDQTVVPGSEIGVSRFAGTFDQELPVTFITFDTDPPEMVADQLRGQLVVIRSSKIVQPNDSLFLRTNPAAVLIVLEDTSLQTESVTSQRDAPSPVLCPAAAITVESARVLADRCGLSADTLFDLSSQTPRVISANVKVHYSLDVERESVDVPNVLGWYPGTDPELRHQFVAVGAHLDHLGIQQGSVYPGADDNGSGTAAVLQIAKAVSVSRPAPVRSVMVMAFCAEERGLLGSKFYVESPTRPLSDMICMLNIDMIGRNEQSASEAAEDNERSIHLVGSKQVSCGLHDLIVESNRSVGFNFEYDEERVNQRSDHASFAAKGVPASFLFGGFNPHYHQTTDTIDGINFTKISSAACLNYLTLMRAAEDGHFVRNSESESSKMFR